MVFEHISGGNLKEYIKENGVLTECQTAFIMKNILQGVKYLHLKNIMHRDIKPENILLRGSNINEVNQMVLADFGFSSYNDVSQYILPKCGTPGFAAPEIYEIKQPTDHYSLKCDIFSVGVTIYDMLTGNLPYSRENDITRQNKSCDFAFHSSKVFKTLSKEGPLLFTKESIYFFKITSKRSDLQFDL